MENIWLSYVSYPVTTAVYFERVLKKKFNVTTIGPVLPENLIEEWKLENMKLPITNHDIPTGFQHDILDLYELTAEKDKPEMFLWIESVPEHFPKNISLLPIPTVCYFIDTHLHLEEHIKWAFNFSYVFIAQKEYIPKFKAAGIKNVYWLPLGCDPEIHGKSSNEKKHEIGFVGSLVGNPRREFLIKKLMNKNLFYYERSFWKEMAKTFSESKIIFNNAINNDLNMRVFEGLCSGSFLLTDLPKNSGQDELFVDGEDLAVYDDKFIVEKAKFYLENDKLREAIAARGRSLVLNAHKYEDRVNDMLDVVEGKKEDTFSAAELRSRSLENVRSNVNAIRKLKRSFIIPVIDYAPVSQYNIKTLLDDLEKIGGEVIVVFNSLEVGEQLRNDPRIDDFAIMKRNVGVARGWNIGMNISRTPISFVLNSDVHIEKEAVDKLENGIIELPLAAMVGPQGSFFHFESTSDIKYFDKGSFDKPSIIDAVSGFLFAVKSKYFNEKKLKFENEFTPCYFEEWDLGYQIKRSGLKSYLIPTTAYDHEWSGSIRSMEKITFYDLSETPKIIWERNKFLFQEKWKKIAAEDKNNSLLVSIWINHILKTTERLIKANELGEAKKIFLNLKNAYPDISASHINLGVMSFLEGNFSEAEKYFTKALELEPDNAVAKDYLKQINERVAK
ncbi:MAG: glycosyltransferase [Chlorobi bacterium]|nr:glycosyltransferase [Chlorobiota bacterium]